MLERIIVVSLSSLVWAVLGSELSPGSLSSKNSSNNNTSAAEGPKIVCYYEYTTNPNDLTTDKVESELCTHINIFGGDLHAKGIFLPPAPEVVADWLRLKLRNPSVKVLLSYQPQLSDLVGSEANIRRFADDVARFLNSSGLDGFDIDWEFPVVNSGKESDRAGFSRLLQVLRTKLDDVADRDDPLLLTIAIPAQYYYINHSYDVPAIAKAVDFVNLMTYDLNYWRWDAPFTAHNSPMLPTEAESKMGVNNLLNMVGSTVTWFANGIPRSKMVVGIPVYGRTYTLKDAHDNGLFAQAVGPRPYSGYADQAQICDLISSGGSVGWDSLAKGAYASKDLFWVSYNNEEAVTLKAEWIKEKQMAGAMIYNFNHDDWRGHCSPTNTTHHLMKTIRNILLR